MSAWIKGAQKRWGLWLDCSGESASGFDCRADAPGAFAHNAQASPEDAIELVHRMEPIRGAITPRRHHQGTGKHQCNLAIEHTASLRTNPGALLNNIVSGIE